MEIVAIIGVILLALLFAFLIYRAARTYDAGAHATFITAKGGEYYGALRAPITLWNPMIKVLKDKHAPAISIITLDPSGTDYFEKSLVTRRTGEVSLRVHVCAPRPFISRTSEKKQLRIKTRVAFQLDIERIQIPSQMEAFGATLGARIENLFDNAIGQYEDQEVFARQSEIEASVLRQLQDIEFPPDPMHPTGMPLGIKVYEAIFSYEPVSSSGVTGDGVRGPMAYAKDDLDDLADMLEKADPKTVEVIMRMMEMQTRQNIVELLCKSGGLVAFTAPELGLSERPIDRALSGINRMTPVAAEPAPAPAQPAQTDGSDTPAAAAPVDPAAAYYGLGAPKQH
ncbi:MAG: hypothetical protein GC155_12475 [Alphaproteobacteria bacterium]|nr:hypothetical protein [Alphaproteobacteria bacterium]